MTKTVLSSLAILVLAYIGFAAVMFSIQERFFFVTDNTPAQNLQDFGLRTAVAETITTPDGAALRLWRIPEAPGMPTIVYFHGNALALSWRAGRFHTIVDAGYGLHTFSYRGYSGSTGSPTERNIYADALRVFDLAAEASTGPLILYGESLGSGVATYIATRRTVAAVVLEAPFTSIVEMARRTIPVLPMSLLVKHRFENDKRIAQIDVPILIAHGRSDEITPFEHGERLYELASQPKRFVAMDATHMDLWENGIFDHVSAFLAEHDLAGSGSRGTTR